MIRWVLEKTTCETKGGELMYVETSLGKVYYLSARDGPTVVLIHGFGCSHVQWMFTAERLAEAGYRSISIDLPGFGSSDLPPHAITTDQYADVVGEIIERLALKDVTLVGNSMGGFVAWLAASQLGSRVRALVLSTSSGAPRSSSLPPRSKRGAKPHHPPLFGPLAAIAGSAIADPLTRHLVRPIIHNSYGDAERLTAQVFDALHSAAKQSRIVLKNRLNPSSITNPGQLLSLIKCPTLILWGDKDRIIPLTDMDYFVDHVPHAKLKVYFGVGHLPMLEIPDEFNADLLQFLKSLETLDRYIKE